VQAGIASKRIDIVGTQGEQGRGRAGWLLEFKYDFDVFCFETLRSGLLNHEIPGKVTNLSAD
jgi:hypothetical protein